MNILTQLTAAAAPISRFCQPSGAAVDKAIACIDGIAITENDVATATASLGAEVAGMPDAQQRTQIVDFLITNQLTAATAGQQKLDSTPAFDIRLQNYRRLALAKEFSKGPEADSGEDIGYFSNGDTVDPFDKAVFALHKSEISELVKTRFGWHAIKVSTSALESLMH